MFRISDILKKAGEKILPDFFHAKSTLGGIELEVISSKSETTKISSTNRRVEKGFNISDSSRSECLLLDITVVDNSFNYLTNRVNLKKLANSGEYTEFNYSGRDFYDHVIITNIYEIESAGQATGLTYNVSLKIIKTAEIEIEEKVSTKTTSGGDKIVKTAEVKVPTTKEKEQGYTLLKAGSEFFGGLFK